MKATVFIVSLFFLALTGSVHAHPAAHSGTWQTAKRIVQKMQCAVSADDSNAEINESAAVDDEAGFFAGDAETPEEDDLLLRKLMSPGRLNSTGRHAETALYLIANAANAPPAACHTESCKYIVQRVFRV